MPSTKCSPYSSRKPPIAEDGGGSHSFQYSGPPEEGGSAASSSDEGEPPFFSSVTAPAPLVARRRRRRWPSTSARRSRGSVGSSWRRSQARSRSSASSRRPSPCPPPPPLPLPSSTSLAPLPSLSLAGRGRGHSREKSVSMLSRLCTISNIPGRDVSGEGAAAGDGDGASRRAPQSFLSTAAASCAGTGAAFVPAFGDEGPPGRPRRGSWGRALPFVAPLPETLAVHKRGQQWTVQSRLSPMLEIIVSSGWTISLPLNMRR
mmetsp:Transcript_21496/g.62905  ORF Transcript_21496/g.62905 Transcript_21496/m.62905 type:complete len:261 (-) Transcript_21496:550-1332(-)